MTTPRKATPRKATPKASMPANVADATTGASLARALDVDPKAFRRWLRRTDVRLAKGAVITDDVRRAAIARYAPKA